MSRIEEPPAAPPNVKIGGWRSAFAAVDLSDVLVVIGCLLIGAGAWQVSQPAALIVVGAIVLYYGMPPRPPFIGGSN